MIISNNKSLPLLLLHLLLLQLISTVVAFPSPSSRRTTTLHQKGQHQKHQNHKPSAARWNRGAVNEFELHESCNETQTNQLRFAFEEAATLAAHARDHVLRFGNESAVYQKYFGGFPPVEVVGAFSMVVDGDKGGLLFRCDDPDGNCAANEGWGGHWRGENASLETVICETSFQERRELSQVCALGYNVAESSRLIFWASDMIHRFFHLPTIGYGHIEHYADGYEEIVTASENGNTNITHDTDALQYFALEAWAHDIAVPGEGCPGPAPEPMADADADAEAESSMTMTMAPTPSESESESESVTPSSTTEEVEASENCHTHSDGVVHCD